MDPGWTLDRKRHTKRPLDNVRFAVSSYFFFDLIIFSQITFSLHDFLADTLCDSVEDYIRVDLMSPDILKNLFLYPKKTYVIRISDWLITG